MPPQDRPPIQVIMTDAPEFKALIAEAYAEGGRDMLERVRPVLERLDLPHTKPVLTVREAARYCKPQVSTDTVLRWIARGLPAERVEGVRGYRIRTEDLEAWLTNRGASPEGA